MRIGEMIALARDIRGVTLRDLERQTGVSNALISQIETGKIRSPSWTAIVRISSALNIGLDRLATCDETSTTPPKGETK